MREDFRAEDPTKERWSSFWQRTTNQVAGVRYADEKRRQGL